ncbi:hypothetical protein VTN00DRAFT_2703 [Thermoascus crustaceus]|uniref:uncharacterized protein n=1 Tax=Thermoascus crustaceus TaxID=5088 RepID=UPI00374499F3
MMTMTATTRQNPSSIRSDTAHRFGDIGLEKFPIVELLDDTMNDYATYRTIKTKSCYYYPNWPHFQTPEPDISNPLRNFYLS